jgi:spore maturation protein B
MNILRLVSVYAIPAIFLIVLTTGLYKEVKVFEVFLEGAKEGMTTVFKILPSLVGLLVAVGVFRASGALDLLIYAVKPVGSILGIPSQALPLAFLRPISGSASLALVSDILKNHGPDSFIGRVVSTMMGSTETILYTLTIYFGAVGIKNIRYTLAAALLADTVSVITSVWICSIVFGK